jgi:hypothetical protein
MPFKSLTAAALLLLRENLACASTVGPRFSQRNLLRFFGRCGSRRHGIALEVIAFSQYSRTFNNYSRSEAGT